MMNPPKQHTIYLLPFFPCSKEAMTILRGYGNKQKKRESQHTSLSDLTDPTISATVLAGIYKKYYQNSGLKGKYNLRPACDGDDLNYFMHWTNKCCLNTII